MEVTILGAGTWGVTLAEVLNRNGCKVSIWHYKSKYIAALSKDRYHPRLNVNISNDINLISSSEQISSSSIILICLPSQSIRDVLSTLKLNNKYYINASKGIELDTGKLISQIIEETTLATINEIACISGPSHAEEIINEIPTVMAVAAENLDFSQTIQETFSNSFLRLYQSESINAMEVGGAVKNIISIASGICVGLGYGDNTIAALITRGIKEIIELAGLYTDNTKSLLGISGIGDLIVTATSDHSRNKKLGILIGTGKTLSESLESMNMIVEGVETTKSVHDISRKNNIQMPICKEVYSILFKNKNPKLAIDDLMSRRLTQE